MNYMEDFVSLLKKRKVSDIPCIILDAKTKQSYLCIEDPHILVMLVGYLKKKLWETEKSHVFFRGQEDFRSVIPRLFREEFRGELTLKRLENRYSAYDKLINELPDYSKKERFKKESAGAILQHYGIKTPWLDLVDNLYTAIWFATKKENGGTQGKKIEYIESGEKYGWIYFIKCNNGSELNWCDLRKEQSSLSLRLH
ncbi:MAG TPA: FRG domain-containing protein, partial [Candidatus Bathyarchaeia archaeon]|nr:FRG domain-containing protein [Candidatus Bathyarchaeia archaeon]